MRKKTLSAGTMQWKVGFLITAFCEEPNWCCRDIDSQDPGRLCRRKITVSAARQQEMQLFFKKTKAASANLKRCKFNPFFDSGLI